MHHEGGSPECVPVGDAEGPSAQADLVLVRVHAAASPRAGGAIGFAGIVEAVAAHITAFQPGDAVFGQADTAFGEYVCAARHRIALKPASLDFDAAASAALSHRSVHP